VATLELSIEARYVSEEEARQIRRAVSSAVVGVIGRAPSSTSTLRPDYRGEPRSEDEAARAAAEGWR